MEPIMEISGCDRLDFVVYDGNAVVWPQSRSGVSVRRFLRQAAVAHSGSR
jgi:hypothetical protein